MNGQHKPFFSMFQQEERRAKDLFQDLSGKGVALLCGTAIKQFDLAECLLKAWVKAIARAEKPFDAETEEAFKEGFRQWVSFSAFLVKELDRLCAGGSVPVKRLIYMGISMASRTRTLSEATGARFKEILKKRESVKI